MFILSLSSCGPEEQPPVIVPEPEQQTIEINTLDLATHYYNLSQKKIVSSHKIIDWDLRLCSQTNKFYIYLNTAKNMGIAKYDGKFSDILTPSSVSSWQTDLIKNGKAMTALGSWGDFAFTNPKSYGYTYIVNLGYLNVMNEFGYRKLQILGCSNNVYTLKYGLLDDPEGDTIQIEKESAYNHMYFSFADTGSVVRIEPPSAEWDIAFTQYGLSMPVIKDSIVVDTSYSWTDFVLLNNAGRFITCDTIKSFDDITFWDAEKYNYSSAIDFIGNRWRVFNPATNAYDLTKRNVYVLKNSQNLIYKIEFKSVDKSNPKQTKIGFRIKNL